MSINIAEILHYAADNCLAAERNQYWVYSGNKEKFSCCAVGEAYFKLHGSETVSYTHLRAHETG
jgi:hypothetical protein